MTHSITLAGNDPAPGTGLWTQVDGPNTATIVDAGLYNTEVNDLIEGTYLFEWALSLNDCGNTLDTVMVTFAETVTPSNAGNDTAICGTIVRLHGNTPADEGGEEIGTWTQVLGNAGPVIQSPNSPNTDVLNLDEGTYYFKWTISNHACSSSTDSVKIQVSVPPSPAITGGNQVICGARPLSFNLSATLPSEGTGIWSIVSGPNTPTLNYSDPAAHVTNLVSGRYIFQWTVSGGPFCADNTNLDTISVGESAEAGNDQLLCSVSVANLVGNSGSTGTWTQIGTTPNVATITTTGSYTATASGLITGTYKFKYSISAGSCPASTDSVQVVISGQPSASNAGPEQALCDATSIQLAGNTPTIGTGTWTKIWGPADGGSFSPDAHAPNATYSTAIPGNLYIFRWTIVDGNCSSASEVRVEDYHSPWPIEAGANQDVCGTTATLDATQPVYGVGHWSQVSGPNTASITSVILPNTTVTNMIQGTYVFKWKVTTGDGCLPDSANVTVTVHSDPTQANAGADQVYCNAMDFNLHAHYVSSGFGEWSKVSGPSGGYFSNKYDSLAIFHGAVPGVYHFLWTTKLAWTPATDTCYTSDEVIVTNNTPPTTANAGSDESICLFQPVYLNGNLPSVGMGTWSQVSGPTTAYILNPDFPVTQVFGVSVGVYKFAWTIVSSGCSQSSDTVKISILSLPSLAIAGANQTLCNNQISAVLEANIPSVGTGTWSQVGTSPAIVSFLDNHDPGTTASGFSVIGTYYLRWEVSTGGLCTNADTVKIFKYPDVIVNCPPNVTICDLGTATLTVTASGGSGTYTYQWESSPTGNDPWTTINGATDATYYTPVLTSDMYYRCIVQCGNVSCAIHVIVVPNPYITVNPQDATICSGTTTTLSVTASGGTPTLLYQWQKSTAGCTSGWGDISGATTNMYTTDALLQTTYYRVRVYATGSGCGFVYSTCATVHIPHIISQSANIEICDGGTYSMNVTVGSESGTATYTYHWKHATTIAGPYSYIPGANSSSYTTDPLATGDHYYICAVEVLTPSCDSLMTTPIYVHVVSDPTIDINPAGGGICSGGNFDLSVTAHAGTPILAYQWQSSPDGSTGWSNVGSNSSSYNTGSLSTTTYYRVIVSASGIGCTTTTSAVATVTVVTDPEISIQPVGTTLCSGGSWGMSVTATGDPLTGSLNYQWQVSTTGLGSWSNATGSSTGSSYTAGPLTSTAYYRVLVSQASSGCLTVSGNATITVVPDPTIDVHPSGGFICYEGTWNLSVTAHGGTPSLHYQWQSSADGSTGWADVGLDQNIYTTAVLTSTTYYRVIVSATGIDCGTTVSTNAKVTVVEDPTIDVNPVSQTICNGDTWNMSVTAHGGTPSLHYQWQSSADGLSGWTNVGTDQNSYTTAALTTSTYYRVLVSATGNGCDQTTSVVAKVTVNNLDAGVIATAQTICETDIPAAFTDATTATGDGTITYQWQISTNGTSFANISGATDAGYSEPSGLTADTWYRRVAASTLSVPGNPLKTCYKSTSAIKVTVNNLSPGTLTARTICEGSTAAITNTAATGDGTLSYQWQSSPDNITYANVSPGGNSTKLYNGKFDLGYMVQANSNLHAYRESSAGEGLLKSYNTHPCNGEQFYIRKLDRDTGDTLRECLCYAHRKCRYIRWNYYLQLAKQPERQYLEQRIRDKNKSELYNSFFNCRHLVQAYCHLEHEFSELYSHIFDRKGYGEQSCSRDHFSPCDNLRKRNCSIDRYCSWY